MHHPTGEIVFILGLHARKNGRNCEIHYCCGGQALKLDSIFGLRKFQVWICGREETDITALGQWIDAGLFL